MKKIIKAILLHLPILSSLYRRYCFITESLDKQNKSIKKLAGANKKQDEEIKKLLLKIEKKDKQIKKLSERLRETEEQLKAQTVNISEQKAESERQTERLDKAIQEAVKSADVKFSEESRKNGELNRRLDEQLSREINKNLIHMKNIEKDLKAKINYKYIQGLHKDDYKRALTEWLYESVGEVGDLDNPRTFNEKIQWIKLHSENELYTVLADKYLVRDWVAEKIGEEYLIPLIGVWDDFDEIDFGKLPEKFVLKANHGCKYNYIVYDKSKFNQTDARNKFSRWMKENFAWNSLELHYKNIPKKIIAEEYLENSDKNLNDYKIFCFNGKPKYIMYVTDRMESIKSAFYDLDWNLMPFVFNFPRYTGEVERPPQLEEMIRLAGILAEGFPHVRVDFYALNDGSIKFGEMTFTTSSGFCRWEPKEYNRILGDMIELPTDKK